MQSLNKGVPVWAPIDIRYIDLMGIVDNKEAFDRVVTKYFSKYVDFLNSLGFFADIEIHQTMSVIIDDNTLERKVIFSLSGFFSSLMFNLNCNNICRTYDTRNNLLGIGGVYSVMNQYEELLRERIQLLRRIKSLNDLRTEFPLLYNKYQEKSKKIQQMRHLVVQLNGMSRSQKRDYIRRFDAQQRKTIPGFSLQKYLNEALSFNLEKFSDEYSLAFTTLVDNSSAVFEYLFTHPITFDGLNEVDKDKLELYLASQFLGMAELVDEDKKQDYLYYVSNYFAEHKDLLDSNLSIVVNSNDGAKISSLLNKNKDGQVLTPRGLYDRYCRILVDNPELRAIDFSHLNFEGMKVCEVKAFMDEYLKDLSANWQFLPPDDRSYEEEVIRKIRTSGHEMSEDERKCHQNRLLELFMEKKELYDSSDPFFRVKGKDTFDGYIGFVYPNGRVVLDKFYDDAESGRLALGHAVYAMGIQEFYELSRLSKTEIIRNRLCKRYVHRGDWADRVLRNEIEAETGIDPSVAVKKFVKDGSITFPSESTNH